MVFSTHSGVASSPRGSLSSGKQATANPIRILHVINDLSIGGAEMMLYKLLSRTDREKFDPAVISLAGMDKLGESIEKLGIRVFPVGMNPEAPRPTCVWRLLWTARRFEPALIQGWMAHGNLAAQFAAVFVPKPVSVLWNIRQSLHSLAYEKPTTARAVKLGARLSGRPARILNNSRKSVAQHVAIGYRSDRTAVIPNGFDIESFTPSTQARSSVRSELGVAQDTLLIGRIGRYHPMKDYSSFLGAAALLLKEYPDTQFVLAGKEVDWNNEDLRSQVQALRMVERVHLLNERLDMPRITAALDIATSSSAYDEGFPNVIGEAMSCGVPCVVTDVGDSMWIVGDTGRVGPPRDPEFLAQAWKGLITLGAEGRNRLGRSARSRVKRCFSLASVVDQYESLYESVAREAAQVVKTVPTNVRYQPVAEFVTTNEFGEEASDAAAEVRRSAASGARW